MAGCRTGSGASGVCSIWFAEAFSEENKEEEEGGGTAGSAGGVW